jgi:hypothetical protein
LYSSPRLSNKERKGQVARLEERRNGDIILTGNPKGKIPLERHRGRWADNIKTDLIKHG